jgi:hypothetical protein
VVRAVLKLRGHMILDGALNLDLAFANTNPCAVANPQNMRVHGLRWLAEPHA